MSVAPQRVRDFLNRSGWSQARLAWEIGVNQPRISRFLNGMKHPQPDLDDALNAFFEGAVDTRARGSDSQIVTIPPVTASMAPLM